MSRKKNNPFSNEMNCIYIYIYILLQCIFLSHKDKHSQGRSQEFLFGRTELWHKIFIKTTLIYIYIYIYTHTFFYYIYTHIYTLFYLISYIYTLTQKRKRKKNLIFSIKVMFDDDLYKIKFIFSIFIVKFLKSFILNTNYQILY